MKCKQKSCNRNKNLLNDGFCNVCNEAIMDINKEYDAQKKINEGIIKDLMGVNEKLRRGETRLIYYGVTTIYVILMYLLTIYFYENNC